MQKHECRRQRWQHPLGKSLENPPAGLSGNAHAGIIPRRPGAFVSSSRRLLPPSGLAEPLHCHRRRHLHSSRKGVRIDSCRRRSGSLSVVHPTLVCSGAGNARTSPPPLPHHHHQHAGPLFVLFPRGGVFQASVNRGVLHIVNQVICFKFATNTNKSILFYFLLV